MELATAQLPEARQAGGRLQICFIRTLHSLAQAGTDWQAGP